MKPKLPCLAALGPLLALVILVGCGGGGGGGGGGDASDAASQAQNPEPEAADPVPMPPTAGTRATCNLANFGTDLLALVNAHRAAGASCGSAGSFPAAAPLRWNPMLTQAALVHSDDMVAFNFLSHTGSDGSGAGQRATAAGYIWQSVGENIAAGQRSVATVVAGWMASPGHCANIMRASFRDIGVACVNGAAGNTYGTYWTMALGLAR